MMDIKLDESLSKKEKAEKIKEQKAVKKERIENFKKDLPALKKNIWKLKTGCFASQERKSRTNQRK